MSNNVKYYERVLSKWMFLDLFIALYYIEKPHLGLWFVIHKIKSLKKIKKSNYYYKSLLDRRTKMSLMNHQKLAWILKLKSSNFV